MRWIHRSERRFSESFFHLVNWWYFLYQCRPQWDPKYHIAKSTTTVSETVPRRERWNSVWWSHTSESNLWENSSLFIMWGYFLFHHGPLWAPKYHFAESTTTLLANCSKKRRVELCVMKSHIRKQHLSKLLSSYYLRIYFLFHHGPLCAPKSHFADSTKRVLANCFLRTML